MGRKSKAWPEEDQKAQNVLRLQQNVQGQPVRVPGLSRARSKTPRWTLQQLCVLTSSAFSGPICKWPCQVETLLHIQEKGYTHIMLPWDAENVDQWFYTADRVLKSNNWHWNPGTLTISQQTWPLPSFTLPPAAAMFTCLYCSFVPFLRRAVRETETLPQQG